MRRLKRRAKQRQLPNRPHKLNYERNNSMCYSCNICKNQRLYVPEYLYGSAVTASYYTEHATKISGYNNNNMHI